MTARRWSSARLAYGLLMLMILLLHLGPAAHVQAQTPTPPPSSAPAASSAPTPDTAAILSQANAAATRADDVAKLAEQATTQASRTMSTIQWMLPIFGFLTALAAVVLVAIGLDVRRGTREIQQGYKEQLKEASDAYKEQIKEARDAYKEQIKEASDAYQQMQQRYKDQLDDAAKRLQETEANLAAQTQQIEDIRQEFTTAYQRYESVAQVGFLLGFGNRLFAEGKRAQAIEAYQEARRLQPDDAIVNYRLGRVYSNVGRLDDAIKTLEHALNAKPDMPEANMELGLAYRRRGTKAVQPIDQKVDYQLAERYLERAIELRPGYEDALATLGGLYRRQGYYDKALVRYQQAFNVDPNSSYGLSNMASLLWCNGEIEQAKYYFDRTDQAATRRIEDGREFGYWDLFDRALARLVLGRAGAREDHLLALARTPNAVNLEGVLDNLSMLQTSPQPIAGLDEFITLAEQRQAVLMREVVS